jgi:hypothetical protein
MRPNIDVNHQWRLALLKADGDLSENGDELLAGLPSACPFSLDDLTEERFEIDRAVKRSAPLT